VPLDGTGGHNERIRGGSRTTAFSAPKTSVSPHDVISSGRICVKTSSPNLLLVAFNTSYW